MLLRLVSVDLTIDSHQFQRGLFSRLADYAIGAPTASLCAAFWIGSVNWIGERIL